jgi:hypothetical protein
LIALGLGFHGLDAGLLMLALSQEPVSASRFVFRLVLTCQLVVAMLAWPR